MDKPTIKQLDFIKKLEKDNEPFTGTTKQEASAYISKHINKWKQAHGSQWVWDNGYT